ncbi:6-phosphogluconolactonase [soil metagenome]
MTQEKSTKTLVYIGTYTGARAHVAGKAEGIYVYQFDSVSGALTPVSKATGIVNPSFLTIDPQQRYLYAVSEVVEANGKPGGGVSAYAIDGKTGELTFLNEQSTRGTDPCYVSVDKTGQYLLVANYTSGSVGIYPILEDGQLGALSDFVQHEGSSVNPQRQQGPHAHSIVIDPANRYAFAPDLGMDKVVIYQLDLPNGKLLPNEPPFVQVAPGAGPRHFDFHPSRQYAYVLNEIGSTVTAFAYDEDRGALTEIQTVPTLPADFTGNNGTADLHVHPSGKFLYGSNRGHDSIAIFTIDESTGQLTVAGHESTQGKTPRNFAIDPTGHFLLAANQNTDTIVTFQIDQQTGQLTPTGQIAPVPTPVCLKLITI